MIIYCTSRSDGWMVARNAMGKVGMVPINFLQVGTVYYIINYTVDETFDRQQTLSLTK